jgi:uncharacterized repeat protein (TIGR01451 family)
MGRFRLLFVSVATAAALATAGGVALAAPAVSLHLTGALLERAGDGTVHELPLTGNERVAPGQTLRYTIVAVNKGNEPARALAPVGRVPAGTAYVGASAPPPAAHLEFSLDGATFADRPTIVVQTPNGPVRRAADPSTYVAVRWAGVKLLPPGASAAFSYTVRVR